jgi:hypothetical protein
MIRLIGWATVIAVGLYTGIIQMVLGLIGISIIWVGSILVSLAA